jgi:hypothetical protein
MKFEITQTFASFPTSDYLNQLIKFKPKIALEFQNLTQSEMMTKAKEQLILLNVYYGDLSYTLIEESEKIDLVTLISSIGGKKAFFLTC